MVHSSVICQANVSKNQYFHWFIRGIITSNLIKCSLLRLLVKVIAVQKTQGLKWSRFPFSESTHGKGLQIAFILNSERRRT